MKTIKPGHHLVRLTLLSNANLGAISGRATLDRPTQVEAYSGLPFIPNSVLRGVLRDACESSPTKNLRDSVEHFFGSRNRRTPAIGDDNFMGNLVIGNGDLLVFPVRALTGERCWVFPRLSLLKVLYLESLGDASQPDLSPIIDRLTQIEKNAAYVLAIPALPPFSAPLTIKQVQADIQDTAGKLLALLTRWSGKSLLSAETVIIADERAAGCLWQQASEVRDATALDSRTKTAKAKSLRRIETIPEGTVFFSFVSLLDGVDFQFPVEIIQLGSDEGTGLGYCQIDMIPDPASPVELASPEIDKSQPKGATETHILLRNAHEAIGEANKNKKEQAFRDKLASAIGDFGWRLYTQGLEATIAFALAKAKPAVKDESKRNPETRAYEWLLKHLLNISSDLSTFNGQPWFSQPFDNTFAAEVLSRWQWLRRCSELELHTSQNIRSPFSITEEPE